MRVSWRTIGIFLALLILLAGMILWITLSMRDDTAGNPIQEFLQPAVPLVEPVVKDVAADRGWQNTGILLKPSETIQVQFMSGEIRDGDTIIWGPAGVGWACGDSSCCEPMPNVDRDAPIGRVRDTRFSIGDQNEITVSKGGELQLRINDCDACLSDNSGSLSVKISPSE